MAVRVPAELVDLFESGVSLFVGTRDADLRPEAVRAVGASVSADRTRVTIFVPQATAARTIANIESNGEVAIGFSRPSDLFSVQVKGRSVDVHLATDAERPTPERYLGAFVEQLYLMGMPRGLTSTLTTWPAYAVTVEVRDMFVQTPGPGAGKRMEAAS